MEKVSGRILGNVRGKISNLIAKFELTRELYYTLELFSIRHFMYFYANPALTVWQNYRLEEHKHEVII
jgi:hypothetical protein